MTIGRIASKKVYKSTIAVNAKMTDYRRALSEIESCKKSGKAYFFKDIAEKYEVNRKTLSKYLKAYSSTSANVGISNEGMLLNGRPPYFDEEHLRAFSIVIKAFDLMGEPLSKEKCRELAGKIHARFGVRLLSNCQP